LNKAGHRGGWGKCSVCLHKDRDAIEQAVIGGLAIAKVAKQFGLSSSALQRHKDRHASTSLVRVTSTQIVPTGDTGDELESLLAEAKALIANAASTTQLADAIDKALKVVVARGAWHEREMARQPSTVINLLTEPAWQEMRTQVMQAIEAHDLKHHGTNESASARFAVSTALGQEGDMPAPHSLDHDWIQRGNPNG